MFIEKIFWLLMLLGSLMILLVTPVLACYVHYYAPIWLHPPKGGMVSPGIFLPALTIGFVCLGLILTSTLNLIFDDKDK